MMFASAFSHQVSSLLFCFVTYMLILSTGRDAPVPRIEDTVGAFINILVCRVKLEPQSTLNKVFEKLQNDYLKSLEYQHTSLARIQHDLTGGKALFNTAISIQKDDTAEGPAANDTITFNPVAHHDPGEYSLTLNINTTFSDEGVLLKYWTDCVSDEQATQIAVMLSKILESFVDQPGLTVGDLKLSMEPGPLERPVPQQLLLGSDDQLRALVNQCVREVIEQMFKDRTLVGYGQPNIPDPMDYIKNQMLRPTESLQVQTMIDYSQLNSTLPGSDIMKPHRNTLHIPSGPVAFLGDEVESKLLNIWSELLQMPADSIRGDDSFFSLGGDSIIG